MNRQVRNFLCDTNGATAIEYALLAALLSIVVIGAITLLGDPVRGLFGGVADHFDAAPTFMD